MSEFKIGDEVWCSFASVCYGTKSGACELRFKAKIIELSGIATKEQKRQIDSGNFKAIQLVYASSGKSPLTLDTDNENRCYSCSNGIIKSLMNMDISIHPSSLISHS